MSFKFHKIERKLQFRYLKRLKLTVQGDWKALKVLVNPSCLRPSFIQPEVCDYPITLSWLHTNKFFFTSFHWTSCICWRVFCKFPWQIPLFKLLQNKEPCQGKSCQLTKLTCVNEQRVSLISLIWQVLFARVYDKIWKRFLDKFPKNLTTSEICLCERTPYEYIFLDKVLVDRSYLLVCTTKFDKFILPSLFIEKRASFYLILSICCISAIIYSMAEEGQAGG